MPGYDQFGEVLGAGGKWKIAINNSQGVGGPALSSGAVLHGPLPTNGVLTGQILQPPGPGNSDAQIDVTGGTIAPLRVVRIYLTGTGAFLVYDSKNAAGATAAFQIVNTTVTAWGAIPQIVDVPVQNGLWISLAQGVNCVISGT